MLARLKSPVFFLTFANLFGAAVSFVSGMLVARWMGSEAYGVMGVLAAVNSTALNFVDLRLGDVMAKLYFRKEPPEGSTVEAFRASLIQTSLLCYGTLAAGFLAIGFFANWLCAGLFTATEVSPRWALASALGTSITYFINPVGSMLRLSGRFYLLGTQSMAAGVVSSGIMVACVAASRDLDGYFRGFLLSNLAGAAICLAVALTVWIRVERLPVLSRLDLSALRLIRGQSRFLFWGNLLGYVKLGHRAADVLLVGWFCDDRVTGLYKLARTLTDKLYMLFDALNQVHFPNLLRALTEGRLPDFRRLARKLCLMALGLTALFLAGEAALLPFFAEHVLQGRFPGVEGAIMVLTVPFFLVTGMYIWLWPLVLHHNHANRFTYFSGIALVIQYASSLLAFRAFHSLWAFTTAYVAYYLAMVGLTWLFLRRVHPGESPFGGPAVKA